MKSGQEFRVGTRGSRLALVQTEEAALEIRRFLPSATFRPVPFATPGDRDKAADLRGSAPDFFTRDLHEAVRAGAVDCAIHSAKDLEDRPPRGLDWFWLSGGADPRDVVVLRRGETEKDLKAGGVAGVSSERREAYCRSRYPHLGTRGIRGTIEERLAQLDAGGYDLLVMAAAALLRLGLEGRIARWISLEELEPPAGQGHLALTFRAGDPRFLRLRSCFVKPVVFAGAGSGSMDSCTIGTVDALARCDLCLYDSLVAPGLLNLLPRSARRVDVGKRCGRQPVPQEEINERITDAARRGWRVVRLKGGDPGVFGRLAEEVEALDRLHLPYRVLPGVSSLMAATTTTGMLLTRRGVSRGFCVMTPRAEGGAVAAVTRKERGRLPMVFFMAIAAAKEVAHQLMRDGMTPDTPAAAVFGAGSDQAEIVSGTLADIGDRVAAFRTRQPGILLVGETVRYRFMTGWGALRGQRVLLTASEALQDKAAALVADYGGIPVCRSLIRLEPSPEGVEAIRQIGDYDWVLLTSPSAVRCFGELVHRSGVDVRGLPKLVSCGGGTSEALRALGLRADIEPEADFGADGLLAAVSVQVTPGLRILRVRSDKAGAGLAQALRKRGADVDDCVIYRNIPVRYEEKPCFDIVFFASASAVESFDSLWGMRSLRGRMVVAIGKPTLAALKKRGATAHIVGPEATVESSMAAVAGHLVRLALREDSAAVHSRKRRKT